MDASNRKRWMDGNFVLDSMRADATEVGRGVSSGTALAGHGVCFGWWRRASRAGGERRVVRPSRVEGRRAALRAGTRPRLRRALGSSSTVSAPPASRAARAESTCGVALICPAARTA